MLRIGMLNAGKLTWRQWIFETCELRIVIFFSTTSYCMYVACNVTYVLVEYSVGLKKELNYVVLSLPAIYLLCSIK